MRNSLFTRGGKRIRPEVQIRTGNTERPADVLPDCPLDERAAAIASLEAIQRSRPLKPPPYTFVEQPRRVLA